MNKNLKLILAATIAAGFVASAHNTTHALVDSQGKAVKDGFGHCVELASNDVNADCVKVLEVDFRLGAHTLFSTNKSTIRPAGRAELDALAMNIKKGAELGQIKQVTGISVVGHTDSVGTAVYNQGLSERRAASVANYLVSKGINPAIISASGKGKTDPVATNKTAAGRQQNRRVDVTIQGVAVKKED